MTIRQTHGQGYTLVEIMIVIAIIATLAAVAVPIFLSSRVSANEVSAIASCRAIINACQVYYVNSSPHTYPPDLSTLGPPDSDPPYLDSILTKGGPKEGYGFVYEVISAQKFTLQAIPENVGLTGNRFFFSDEIGVIKAKNGGAAGPSDPPIE